MNDGGIVVLTTVASEDDAKRLAHIVVEQRLAACVNILPQVQSIYRWEGRVTEESEHLLLIKTVRDRLDELQEAVLAAHPYEVPEFVVLEIDQISGPYHQWLLDSVKPM